MKLATHNLFRKAVAVTALFCMTTQTTFAALLDLSQQPLTLPQVTPKVMLTVSKDQQLFKKAYNDYSDLDGDSVVETTYKHTVEYFGYFDPYKCYTYVNSRFEPQANSASKLCNGTQWSGNFLNWAAMSRMDAVRKLLYGGLRSIDEKFDPKLTPSPITVLERAYLPPDAHAWAKHYNPNPAFPKEQPSINQLTPFNPPTTPAEQNLTSSPAFQIPAANGDYTINFTTGVTGVRIGDQITLYRQNNFNQRFTAAVLDITNKNTRLLLRVNVVGTSGSGNHTPWTLRNLSTTGISFCNVTIGAAVGTNSRSSTNANPPLLRVAQGNFALWSANERVQCQWFEERSNLQAGFGGGLRSNGNQASLSNIDASAENPIRAVHALSAPAATNGEYIVRVKVCDPKLFDANVNAERCKRYPAGNLKPAGLIQEYGDNGRFHFGLMTGSYAKNISGGVLRKNPGPMSDEIRVDIDGAFREANVNAVTGLPDGTYRDHPYQPRGFPRTTASAASPPGIINTLNYMRLYGYHYPGTGYLGASGDNCTYQLTSFTENQCTSWGNPMSEIFFEAVRYFGGRPASGAYTYTSAGSKDNELGLPLSSWRDPLNKTNYCANLNVLVFNASVSDNDEDLRARSAADISSATSIAGLTDIVGNASNENINGNRFFVGKILGTTPAGDPGFELCTSKTVGAFGNVSGICPEGPTTAGSYLMAGIAHHARTNFIRTDLAPLVPAGDTKSLRVNTYGVQLASNTPEFVVTGAAGQRVVIQPIYRLNAPGGVGGGGLVDIRVVRLDTTGTIRSGKVYVNWEDSEQGGDYDQDMWGTIEWTLNTLTRRITITTNAVSASSANPQGFGYSVSGTTKDGPHFHSGIYGFNYKDPTGVLGCTNCNLVGSGGQVGPQSVTYDLADNASAGSLRDPLWYAAKYGGFVDSNNNKRPDQTAEYDTRTASGATGSDGVPDNYFLVTNPLGLVTALRAAFGTIGKDTSGTALMANSTALTTTTRIYQARYDPDEWSGQLLAKDVDPLTGTVSAVATWDAGLKLNSIGANNRAIVTFDDAASRDGVAFRSGSISANMLLELNKSPVTGLPDALGVDRLNWLRGDASREVRNGGIFRNRPSTVLGDIVSSDPSYVGPPSLTTLDSTYAAFRRTYQKRTPMLYVGANDGMVHGFDAITGLEKLAYIPSKTFPHLAKLTSPIYSHRFFVDGPTEAVDAKVNGAWRTVLVGGLGAGGQGLYALDVTNPDGEFSEGRASQLVMWEFNDTDDRQVGYVYGKPVVRRMHDNRYAAIVSAGYNNSEGDAATGNGRAYLYVIFLDGPTGAGRTWIQGRDYIKIDTGEGTPATPNGLAAPMVADADADGKADFAYAGDLMGNFWKFDLRANSPLWKMGDDADPDKRDAAAATASSQARVPLYKAIDGFGNAQPITAAAEGMIHPTGRGFIIVFGTGKYLEPADTMPVYRVQSYYGIWDKNDSEKGVVSQTTVARNQLLEQVLVGSAGARYIDPERTPDWKTHFGWFMDFPNSATTGERAVFRPLLMSRRLIFTTLIPVSDPCAGGGTSFLMVINPSTGGNSKGNVLDVNRDGILNDSDMVNGQYVVGVESTVGIAPTPVVVKGGPQTGKVKSDTARAYGSRSPTSLGGSVIGRAIIGGPLGVMSTTLGLQAGWGRVTWRELIN